MADRKVVDSIVVDKIQAEGVGVENELHIGGSSKGSFIRQEGIGDNRLQCPTFEMSNW